MPSVRLFFWVAIGFGFFGLLSSCKDGLTAHNLSLGGVKHGEKLYQGAKNCTACHGVALQGNGWIPSCYHCHEVLWNKESHQADFGGVMHLARKPAVAQCTQCHGVNLEGSGHRPGCKQCHGEVWREYSLSHNALRSDAWHGAKLFEPDTYCSSCHGPDLKGQPPVPSCFACHQNKWSVYPGSHNTQRGGKGHASNLYNPSAHCTNCHGKDLKGKTPVPGCRVCHEDLWIKSNHSKIQPGGNHALGSAAEYCSPCHGSDLRGGSSPEVPTRPAGSCFACHSDPAQEK